jgi:vitamin B12 transporter
LFWYFFMQSFHSCLRALLLAGLALLSAQSHGQSPITVAQLSETVVTASRVEQRIQDALPASTLITRADIERAQTPDLPTLLQNVAGIEISQSGGPGTVATAFMRGAESRHTLVLIDGVAVNNLNFGLAALEHLPLANVERIEIVRGNVSSLYGSAALGGVIQIFTRETADGTFASLSAQAGSRGLWQTHAAAAIKTAAGTRLSLTAESIYDKGFNAINQSKISGTNPDTDGYSRSAYSIGLSQDLSFGKIGLSVRDATGVTNYDSQFGPANQADQSTFNLQGAALTGLFKLSPSLELDTALTRSADKLKADITAFPFFVNSYTEGGNAGLRWQFVPGHTLTSGFESSRQRIESDTTYNASSRQLDSARIGYQGNFESHQIQLNARQDHYSDFGSPATWYAGYAYRFTPAWRLNVSASTGFNAPTFNDLYYPFGGNANLRPEQLNSNELGLQYAAGNQEARMVWFSNRFKDLIGDDASFNRVNINQARIDGLESSYRNRWDNTSLRSALTLQNPVDLTTGQSLNRRAAVLAQLGLSQDRGPWSYGANLRFSGERPDGTHTLASYTVLDLLLSHALSREVKLFGRIENLMDVRYETVYGYNTPGFGVFVGMSWQPGLQSSRP